MGGWTHLKSALTLHLVSLSLSLSDHWGLNDENKHFILSQSCHSMSRTGGHVTRVSCDQNSLKRAWNKMPRMNWAAVFEIILLPLSLFLLPSGLVEIMRLVITVYNVSFIHLDGPLFRLNFFLVNSTVNHVQDLTGPSAASTSNTTATVNPPPPPLPPWLPPWTTTITEDSK